MPAPSSPVVQGTKRIDHADDPGIGPLALWERDCPNYRGHRRAAMVDENGTVVFIAQSKRRKIEREILGDNRSGRPSSKRFVDEILALMIRASKRPKHRRPAQWLGCRSRLARASCGKNRRWVQSRKPLVGHRPRSIVRPELPCRKRILERAPWYSLFLSPHHCLPFPA